MTQAKYTDYTVTVDVSELVKLKDILKEKLKDLKASPNSNATMFMLTFDKLISNLETLVSVAKDRERVKKKLLSSDLSEQELFDLKKGFKEQELLALKKSDVSKMDLVHSAAHSIYKDVKYISETLSYNDPEIVNFLNNKQLSAISPKEAEECSAEFKCDEIKDTTFARPVQRKEEELDEIDWGESDDEEKENHLTPKG
ncbi:MULTISPECIES: hypothetical protein [Legionella]|uniref:Coiled coil protein n=1 Tax=Legionella resiliens TaxID=2905958 RepID=A0ABS8X5S4_9GAMM|nr:MULTISPECIES: hypothetical protein [unclassified Legionella]MCE0723839.1 hypothetical protein [Legionella sp. 9fVS26]MCE3532991.1 hypothetical protein [Legionella sp. 8cVS16]QLZ69182.1 hypothetical protein FOLKNPGA_01964 [Legionella sp. PC1000]